MENSSGQNPATGKHGTGNPEHNHPSHNPTSKDRDTSQKGREEEVVNQQDQGQTTNSDHGDTTNKSSDGTLSSQTPATGSSEKEDQYRQGLGDNDKRNPKAGESAGVDPGKPDDSKRSESETPPM